YVLMSHRRSFYFRRFPSEVVHNPVNPEFDRFRDYRDIPPKHEARVGMVARLDPIKDHSTVIRAAALAIESRPDLVIEFAGDGERRVELEDEARRLRVADCIRFLGFAHVAPLLARWDIYVHSTTEAEGMGTAVAEAMLAGLPCVVTDLPMMREICGPDG